jgi:hypothetical protein
MVEVSKRNHDVMPEFKLSSNTSVWITSAMTLPTHLVDHLEVLRGRQLPERENCE